jgi:hypothetical protein
MNSTPTKNSPTMVDEEFPTRKVSNVQLYDTFRGNEHRNEHYNDLFHLNRPSDEIDI